MKHSEEPCECATLAQTYIRCNPPHVHLPSCHTAINTLSRQDREKQQLPSCRLCQEHLVATDKIYIVHVTLMGKPGRAMKHAYHDPLIKLCCDTNPTHKAHQQMMYSIEHPLAPKITQTAPSQTAQSILSGSRTRLSMPKVVVDTMPEGTGSCCYAAVVLSCISIAYRQLRHIALRNNP